MILSEVDGYRRQRASLVELLMLAHERFKAWQLAHQLTLAVYQATQTWPASERYGLIAQIRRAASAVPTNLAEGAAKHGRREFRRFADIALGSIAEVAYLLLLARDLDILPEGEFTRLDDLRKRAGGLIWRLARALDSPAHA
jgi:four helix bundle protein